MMKSHPNIDYKIKNSKPSQPFISKIRNRPIAKSWCCSNVLGCTQLHSFVLHFNISPHVQCFPILIWQKGLNIGLRSYLGSELI